MELKKIVKFLNKELRIKQIEDSSKNGLQFYGGKKEILKIGVAVDACLDTFEKAKKQKVDLLIVHHGIKWKGIKHKIHKNQLEDFLRKNKIALYAAHLPLDMHEKYGNNMQLCNFFGLRNIEKFAKYHGFAIGYKGEFKKLIDAKEFVKIVDKKLSTRSIAYLYGKKKIKNIGVVSGGGSFALHEAFEEKLDAFLTGESKLSSHNLAKDLKINYICAGHYATETLGVQAIGRLLQEKFKLNVVFIDNKVDI